MSRVTEGVLPPPGIPAVTGDFNAVGLSGDAGDDCIYWLDSEQVAKAGATIGSIAFVYELDEAADGSAEVFGFVCSLERVPWAEDRWRGRPRAGTWFRGAPPWSQPHDA